MDFEHFVAGDNDDNRRIDRVLRRFLPDENLSSLYKYIRKGLVKIDGKKVSSDFRIKKGCVLQIASFLISVNLAPHKTIDAGKKLPDSLVIYRDDDILIMNKPYDVPVQPSSSSEKGTSLSELVEADYLFHHRNKGSLSFRTGPLHRLDRKTTGLLVFSQSLYGAQKFSELIQSHSVKKIYVGIVRGKLLQSQRWTERIKKNDRNDEKNTVQKNIFRTVSVAENRSDNGKVADTEALPLAYGHFGTGEDYSDVTLVEFIIGTGRTHQIRAQAAFHGFPLLGDSAYGGGTVPKKIGREFFLHAYELRFPADSGFKVPEKINASLSSEFEEILAATLIKWKGDLII